MNSKDVGLRVRVDGFLRQEFISACREEDKTAAQVVRAYMREYVEKHKEAKQQNLFTS